jgi:hypothetical protein
MSLLSVNRVRSAFSEIIKNYDLSSVAIDGETVGLIHQRYMIYVSADRDGINYVYYDTEATPPVGYNLAIFLVNKRRDLLKFEIDDRSDRPLAEYLDYNLTIFSKHLISAAKDILVGDKKWILEYSWPPAAPIVSVGNSIK